MALFYGYLFYVQFNSFDYATEDFFCKGYIPCFLFYSRYSADNKFTYSATIICSSILILIVSFSKWLEYKKRHQLMTLFDRDEGIYAKMLFNSWDWRAVDNTVEEDLKYKLLNKLRNGLMEIDIKERIKYRTTKEWRMLYFRRILSTFASLIVMLIGILIILGAYVLRGYLGTLTSNQVLAFLIDLVPGFGLSIAEIVMPYLSGFLIDFEKWDYQSTILNQNIWRRYISKAFSLLVVYFLNVWYILYSKTTEDLTSIVNLEFELSFSCPGKETFPSTVPEDGVEIGVTNYNNCPEDEMVYNLFINVKF